MNKFSIPAFIEDLTPDTANSKYSRGKLKIYYVGETVDKRLFTKEFSDKLLATAAYTPVVGFYSIADEDFIGHNNVQHIYGLIPESAELAYVEDAEQGVTFAVTDVILYTGRPDETGTIAAKIIGKQHSLELNPDTVQYKINRDGAGNFKNIEFTAGELVGLSVLGDNDTPAFSGSEFFSAEELPDFVTEENKSKYQALFNTMFNVEPTAEEVVEEICRALSEQGIYGYICEHIADKYVIVCVDSYKYARYICSRDEAGRLQLTFDSNVRRRYLSDAELETLSNTMKGPAEIFENVTETQTESVVGSKAAASDNTTASANIDEGAEPTVTATANDEENDDNNPKQPEDGDKDDEEFQALRSNCERLESTNQELLQQIEALTAAAEQTANAFASLNTLCRNSVLESYKHLLNSDELTQCSTIESVQEMIAALETAYAAQKNNTDTTVFEMSIIGNSTSNYDETDEVAVVQKYTNMNRGKN